IPRLAFADHSRAPTEAAALGALAALLMLLPTQRRADLGRIGRDVGTSLVETASISSFIFISVGTSISPRFVSTRRTRLGGIKRSPRAGARRAGPIEARRKGRGRLSRARLRTGQSHHPGRR